MQEVLRNGEQQVSTNRARKYDWTKVSTMHEVGPVVCDYFKDKTANQNEKVW